VANVGLHLSHSKRCSEREIVKSWHRLGSVITLPPGRRNGLAYLVSVFSPCPGSLPDNDAAFTALASWVAGSGEAFRRKDAQCIVIDEVAGYL